ncbi:M28 family peptidase [uncultured Sphingomonas sp.]|uniref:M28 family peptidase n=1 Tax=uncultured Sphingomonas sp. TaxID=158754 RepID=UPI0025E77D57|nr:M28 family peptidase [uncultured Sphingomonas sp.]
MRLRLAALPLLSLAAALPAQTPARSIVAPVAPISEQTLKDVTKELSSDAYEGRAPGTAGEEKTVAYLAKRFAAAGLKPGNKGSWYQDVPLVELTAKNVSPLVFTGAGAPLSLSYGPDMVVGTWRITPRVEVKDSPVVFVGYGINAPEKGWNDYAGLDVRGKTVLILVNDPDWKTPGLTGPFGGRAMTYYGRWTYKYEEAARQGAAAAIIVHQTEPAAYGWNVVQSSWTGAQQVADAADNHAGDSAAIGWMQEAQARKLFEREGLDFDALAAAAGRKGFRARPLNGVRASVSFDETVRRHRSRNVIGILPGTTRPGEYVLYSAHWDHLGHCEAAPDGDDICNGAIDNATGTAALVALAEANARAGATARSQLFVAVTGEESGLLGSEYYAANPVYPLSQTVGGVNMDALSLAGPAKNVVVVGKGKSELDAYLDAALATQGRVASREPTPEKGFYYRSDHFSLAKRGVPMIYFDAGDDLVAGGTAAGAAAAKDYEEHRYHGPKDEYDPNWNWAGTVKDLQLYYGIGRALAQSDQWPNWVSGDEFRAIRDKSRASAATAK